jgi:hypothetical protein
VINVDPPGVAPMRYDGAPALVVPETLAETGLTMAFVGDLLLKVLQLRGAATGAELADTVRLPFMILDDVLLDLFKRWLVEGRGAGAVTRANYMFDLTAAGEERAQMELAADVARYLGLSRVLTTDVIERACESYFLSSELPSASAVTTMELQ